MSELDIPETWAESSFGECVTFRTGFAFKSSEYTKDGVFVLRVTNISPNSAIDTQDAVFISEDDFNDKYRSFELFEGDVVIVMVGATTGKIGVISRDILPSVLNQNMWKLSPNWDSAFSTAFLFFLLKHSQKAILTGAAGSATGFIKQGEFKQRPFPLPPLGEQRRIVAKIESTFKRIEAIEKAVQNAESLLTKYRESLLNKAFRGELVPQDPNDEPASKLLERIRAERAKQQDGKKKKKDDLPPITEDEIPFEIPKSWEWVRIPEVGTLARGKSKHRPRNDRKLFGGNYPFIQTGDVAQSNGYIVEYSQTYSDFGLAQSRLFPAGTLCITIAANIADTAILTFPACFPDSVVGYTADGQSLSAEFLKYFIELMKVSINNSAHGAAQKNINLEVLGDLPVPLPPFAEQLRIIETLKHQEDAIGKSVGKIKEVGFAARKQRNSLLGSAFSGRLVPQDPSEGTGHQLLEQILASKNDSGTAKLNAKDAAAKPKPRKPKK